MARPLTVVPARPVSAVSAALTHALAGSSTICVLPDFPAPTGQDWPSTLHLDQPVPRDVAALVATSGSTGAPHAVQLTAAALLASAHGAMRRLAGPVPGFWHFRCPRSAVCKFSSAAP